MPSLVQLCRDVVTKTGRPELMDETQLAVRDATKFLHMQEFFMRDADEILLQFNPDFIFQIDTSTKLERFRKVRFIKKYDTVQNLPKEGENNKITECGPDFLFDRYSNPKKNIFYMGGTNLNIRLDTQEQALLVSWYKYPTTDPENYNSWIAEMYSPAIVDKATAQIFRDTGMKDDANALDKVVMEVHLPIVRMNDIEATAR